MRREKRPMSEQFSAFDRENYIAQLPFFAHRIETFQRLNAVHIRRFVAKFQRRRFLVGLLERFDDHVGARLTHVAGAVERLLSLSLLTGWNSTSLE